MQAVLIMMSMLADLRFVLRSLLRMRGLALTVVASIGLGIGCVTTTLSWLDHLVRRPLAGVGEIGQLAVILSNQGGGNCSLPDVRDFGELRGEFVGVAATQITVSALRQGERTEWVHVQLTTANLFSMLEVSPMQGRFFRPDEDRTPGGDRVVVLSERLWKRAFDSDPTIVGQQIELNRHAFTVIGVAPADFGGSMSGLQFEVWAPVTMSWELAGWTGMPFRRARMFHTLAVLQPGVTVERAQAALGTVDERLQREYPKDNHDASHRVRPHTELPWGAQGLLLPAVKLLLVVSALILLLVVANVSNLLLARLASRRSELALRVTFGAGRGRLVRLLAVECLVLAAAGGLVGAGVASWAGGLLLTLLPPIDRPVGGLAFTIDGATLAMTGGLVVATAVAIGLVPLLGVLRAAPADALKEGGRPSTGGGRQRWMRAVLVGSEVALAVVLLVCTGLCVKGLARASRADVGFDARGVLIGELRVNAHGYDETRGIAFYEEARRRVAEIPGVRQAALASWFPLGFAGCKGSDARPDGYVPRPGENPTVDHTLVSGEFFGLMGIPLLEGRTFDASDRKGRPAVAVVNETFARHYWPDRGAVGRTFRMFGMERTIVGVVRDVKMYRLNEPARRLVFLPFTQGVPELDLGIAIKVAGDPAAFGPALTRTLQGIDPQISPGGVMTLTDYTRAAVYGDRVASAVLAVVGTIAVVLAAVGVYAVMAFSVAQRTREIGVRVALGATPRHVLALVLGQGLSLVAAGVLAGVVLAALGTGLLSRFLHGVSPFDAQIFIGVPLMLGAVGVIACLAPSLRALRVQPVEALRCE
jgi:predicted permease